MTPYRIEWQFDAGRFFKKLGNRKLVERIYAAVEELRFDPRPHNCKRLQGIYHRYLCVRVSDYRVVYEVFDDRLVIVVVKIDDRREVYR